MATELASIVQSAHINHEPSVEHDINPSTAASKKVPASIITPSHHHSTSIDSDSDDNDEHLSDITSHTSSSTLPSDIIRPRPRVPPGRHHLPLPDLRFEQTYLASLKSADTTWKVIYITVRDQVLLPLVQGVGYHLLVSGWRFWNRGSQFTGRSVGARVRQWWWGVNGWKIPETQGDKAATEVKDFYVGQFGSALGD